MEEYEQLSLEGLNTNFLVAGYNSFLYLQACEEDPSLLRYVFTFSHTPEFCYLACDLFHLFYLDDSKKEYMFYLLHQEFVRPCDLSFLEVRNLFRFKKWGSRLCFKES